MSDWLQNIRNITLCGNAYLLEYYQCKYNQWTDYVSINTRYLAQNSYICYLTLPNASDDDTGRHFTEQNGNTTLTNNYNNSVLVGQ